MNKNNLISTADLARILGVTRQAIQKMLDKNAPDIKPRKVGASFLYEIDSLPGELQERILSARQQAVEKLQSLKPMSGKDLDFEKELWKAADKLRGNIDASEYKHIVLGLLFLKYVSDFFYFYREDLEKKVSNPNDKKFFIAEKNSREYVVNDKDQYRGVGVFYIPEKARWDYLRAHAMHHDIGKYIDEAMDAVEQENPKQLTNVLPRIYTRTPLESHILGELVNIFSRIQFNHDLDKEKDILGRVYEYFLGQFASAEGKRGGEFYTPRPIVRTLVQILEPYENSRVLDPACGSGGMFAQSSAFLKEHNKDPYRIAIFGQESNQTTMRLAKMNLAIRGIFGQIELGNTYYDDKFPNLRADFVLANPPFNADWDPGRLSEKDPRTKFGTPPSGNANFMWIQHFIQHLAPNGMAGFVMANGALAVGGKEGEIRKKIIEEDLVDIIIACPPKMFYSVALPVSLWFISKNKTGDRFRNRAGETLFIDARETFEPISRKQVIFTEEQINKIANTARAWRGQSEAGEYKDIPGFCKASSKKEIIKNGYVLTPGRYVGVAEEEDDGVPFEEKVSKLQNDLTKYFVDGEKLQEQIMNNLKGLEVYK